MQLARQILFLGLGLCRYELLDGQTAGRLDAGQAAGRLDEGQAASQLDAGQAASR